MFDNSDDHDFNPSGSSKLASLFENPMVSDSLNSSLTYTAPKQPKADKELETTEPSKNKVQTSLLLAKVVSLWKLEHKDYKMMGKHGLAVIGSLDLNLFEIIVYKEKNNILLRKKISSNCSFYNQKECFSSFYDNDNQNWLVKFESLSDQTRFCREIQNYGASIKVADGSQKKEKMPSSSNRDNSLSKPDVLPKSVPMVEEGHSSDSSGSQKRANILTRMAKMGQQILPNQMLKNASADVSDSEVDDYKTDRKAAPRKVKRTIHIEKSVMPKEEAAEQQTYLENQMVPSQSNNLNYSTQFPPMAYTQPAGYDGFNHYIASQNTELKMNLAQISAKLDSALSGNSTYDKYEDRALKSKIKALELKIENLHAELQRYEDKYLALQKKYDDLQKKGTQFEGEDHRNVIVKLTEDLKAVREKVEKYEMLEKQLEACKTEVREHEKTIETQREKLKDFEEFNQESKDNENRQATIDNLKETVASLQTKLVDFKDYIHETEEERQAHIELSNKIVNLFSGKIKENMDDMYQSILANFNQDGSYSMAELKTVVAQNVKGTTFKIIEDFTNIYKNVGLSNDSQTE